MPRKRGGSICYTPVFLYTRGRQIDYTPVFSGLNSHATPTCWPRACASNKVWNCWDPACIAKSLRTIANNANINYHCYYCTTPATTSTTTTTALLR